MIKIGIDIGSTTIKVVVLDDDNNQLYRCYQRHLANAKLVLIKILDDIQEKLNVTTACFQITGSVGLGVADLLSIPFRQEVVCVSEYVKSYYPSVSAIIDVGGEDSKIVYLQDGKYKDLRMNSNCAGGTGAFIDQMAVLLNVSVEELNKLALSAHHIYPIASRCGVFSKTDIQNLIAKNASKEDLAASIFRAVAVQTITTLSKSTIIKPMVLFCGGPLSFLESLRKAFYETLNLNEADFILPNDGETVCAYGAALSAKDSYAFCDLTQLLQSKKTQTYTMCSLAKLFKSEGEYCEWKEEKSRHNIIRKNIDKSVGELFLGIDSGSTTTKIVAVDRDGRIRYSYYCNNQGDPINTVLVGLNGLKQELDNLGINPSISGSCSTGYGEELIKTSLGLQFNIVETIAHFMAAKRLNPDVSFVLDIGGQDMKAIFVTNGVLTRIEINEACSSGCGSFLSSFANSLNYKIEEFVKEALTAKSPADLGTRCTVFMNSKVKQAMREGATVGDISAGLSYSVVKNCLYKVLKIADAKQLGDNIVLQGGTMRNDAIVKAFEVITQKEVVRSNFPELMGAYGCALYAIEHSHSAANLESLLSTDKYSTKQISCKGCENNCLIQQFSFNGSRKYYSGNKCENIFNNYSLGSQKGDNGYNYKLQCLFDRAAVINDKCRVGIPRILNFYENYPFWHTLFTQLGIEVVLSDKSTFSKYERSVQHVMSDNICFPAKLVHSHINNLIDKKVDRIFMPFVQYEKMSEGSSNSYNCPIVSGYNEVVKNTNGANVVVDSPVITFKDVKLLEKQCIDYFLEYGIAKADIKKGVKRALEEQTLFEKSISDNARQLYVKGQQEKRLTIVLAGRPYHSDPLIQHKISDVIASMGVQVVSEDILRSVNDKIESNANIVRQWSYINRIMRTAEWVANAPNDIHFVQLTSFGCGPDAFLIDEIKQVLKNKGKTLTILKIDDINNVGSLKLRIRSLIESLKMSHVNIFDSEDVKIKAYTKEDRKRRVILPYFTDYLSPLLPSLMGRTGYDAVQLPKSSQASVEMGLKYANNEICYPATLIVGDIISYLQQQNDLDEICVGITQTGGQCRASNYISIIKRALIDAGFSNVPVVAVTSDNSALDNDQSNFKISWRKVLPIAIASFIYADVLSKIYHSAVVREKEKGSADKLKEKYLRLAVECIDYKSPKDLYRLITQLALEFDDIIDKTIVKPKVGIVGEIFLKFHSFANHDIVKWLMQNGMEVVPPVLLDFFMQSFVNLEARVKCRVETKKFPLKFNKLLFNLVNTQIEKANKLAQEYSLYEPIENIYKMANNGEKIVSLINQYGEGWLLPAEIVGFVEKGIDNVVCVQPFGCIANHIVARGVEKKIKDKYPSLNLLSLDFDSGVSSANVVNRLLLFASRVDAEAS